MPIVTRAERDSIFHAAKLLAKLGFLDHADNLFDCVYAWDQIHPKRGA
jgi:hypothetical protein